MPKKIRIRPYVMTAGSGSFALTGQAATLTYAPSDDPVLVAGSGSFTLTGSAATLSYSGDELVWQIPDEGTIYTDASTSETLATGVPTGAIFYASPDLLPGQTLEQSGDTLSLVSDSTVPTVNDDTAGDVLDEVSDRDIVIEVMDSPIAHIRNATQGIEYPYADPGSWSSFNSQPSNRWNWVLGQSAPGDVIEISPGAVHAVAGDFAIYQTESGYLQVQRPINIKNMDGRGRWRILPSDFTIDYDRSAIVVQSPAGMYAGSGTGSTSTGSIRGTFTIEGFDAVDQFGTSGSGVKMRPGATVDGSWDTYHSAFTLRNFKIGKTSGISSSGLSGGCAETFTIEAGHVYDCGDGGGLEHNVYVSARTLNVYGVRFARTRGHSFTPVDPLDWENSVTLEGHLFKASAVTGNVEGCSFDCVLLGDQSHLLQMKAGGNWIVRGNLFVDSGYPMTARGMLNMCREFNSDTSDSRGTTNGSAYAIGATSITLASSGSGSIPNNALITFAGDANKYRVLVGDTDVSNGGTITLASPGLLVGISAAPVAITLTNIPNHEWWAGDEGNSLTLERNVFVGHYPRPIIGMFDWSAGSWTALHPPGSSVPADSQLATMLVQDNIAMVTGTAAEWMLPGFPGTNDAMWINYDPTGGTYWTARNNTKVTYDSTEAAFDNRLLKIYTRAAGTIAATGGTVATKRFVWPHGYMTRSDAYRGLA